MDSIDPFKLGTDFVKEFDKNFKEESNKPPTCMRSCLGFILLVILILDFGFKIPVLAWLNNVAGKVFDWVISLL